MAVRRIGRRREISPRSSEGPPRAPLRTLAPVLAMALAVATPMLGFSLHHPAARIQSNAAVGTPPPTPPTQPHYVVLLVIDAGRPSYLSLAPLPHIKALMRQGVVYDRAWVGQLESSTPGVHVTFGTGTLPRQNGYLAFGWAADKTRQQIDFRTLLTSRQIEPSLRRLPAPGAAALLQRTIPGAVAVAGSGHKDYAVVGLGGGAATYEIYGQSKNGRFTPTALRRQPPLTQAERRSLVRSSTFAFGAEDYWAFQYALATVRHVRPRLLMLNLPEVDTRGHRYGPRNHAVIRTLMQNIDRGVGQVENTYRKLGILGQTTFIITADHAMMESRGVHDWHDVWVAASSVKAGVARADGESGAIWLERPEKARQVAQQLVAMKPPHVAAIFYHSTDGGTDHYVQASPTAWLVGPRASQAMTDLANTTAGRDAPDLWMLYRENYTADPSNVKGIWKGTHGGATWKVQHVPLIISGAGVRHGLHSQFPARAIDIAPTMERLLGLKPAATPGGVLADALADASTSEQAAQSALAPSLTADVLGLQAQSRADVQSNQG